MPEEDAYRQGYRDGYRDGTREVPRAERTAFIREFTKSYLQDLLIPIKNRIKQLKDHGIKTEVYRGN